MTELEELRLAYAECSRQRNELLTAHKKGTPNCRVCKHFITRGMGCGSIVVCVGGDVFNALPALRLWKDTQ